MIISKLILKNFGSYLGTTTFNLGVQDKLKPIILIGGKNGAGKSTFFEAIKCCLYGKRSRGHKIRMIDYETYLRNRINYNTPKGEKTEIELHFRITDLGNIDNYTVTRSWFIDSSDNLIYELIMLKNGKIFDKLPKNAWQNYIFNLLPPNIIDLYFFDSEDLKLLAINDETSEYLGSALNKMLGIHFSEQLKIDLDYQLTQLSKDANENGSNLELLQKRKSELLEQIEKINIENASLTTETIKKTNELNKYENEFLSYGGQFAENRAQNHHKKFNLEKELSKIILKIKTEAANLLPFLGVQDRISKLLSVIEQERISENDNTLYDFLNNKISNNPKIDEFIKNNQIPNTNKFKQDLLDLIIQKPKKTKLVFNLSEKEFHHLQNIYESIQFNYKPNIIEIFTQAKILAHKQDKINEELNRAPPEDDIKPLFDHIKDLNQSIGKLTFSLEQNNTIKSQRKDELSVVERKMEKERKTTKVSDKKVKKRILDVHKVLKLFIPKIRSYRIEQLETSILRNFRKICRKGAVIEKIIIDKQTFIIKLLDNEGNNWDKMFLSEGEKQLFALSILWSLTQNTGKNYPFIIDTPLSRLDEEHRIGLINDFFINASEQLIILSTNEEVDFQYYKILKDHVSKLYLLEYDLSNKQTIVSENKYFISKTLVSTI